ncbi:hypothetical protein PQR71_42280 [Paraburkholderia fungorum]|uniref:hypothetical protein n=1 Tax=Paraburkholderia fungorum TaxID=134537 RepID=UPI0038B7BA8D
MKDGRHNNWGQDWNVHSLRRRFWNGQSQAHAAVNQAVKRGELKPAKEFTCADCPAPATDYDHRDYGKPLVVVAVCRMCNLHRGRALPKRWTREEAAQFARQQVIKSCDWNWATTPDLTAKDYKQLHLNHWVLARRTALAHWLAARQIFGLRDVAHELYSELDAYQFEIFSVDEYLDKFEWLQLPVVPSPGKKDKLAKMVA